MITKPLIFRLLIASVFLALPACKTNSTKPGVSTMRIWLAPAYRAETTVNQAGHLLVTVGDNHETTKQAHKATPYRR